MSVEEIRVYNRYWYAQNKERLKERKRENQKGVRNRNADFVFKYLQEHPCIDCGESNPIVLEFDHVKGDKVDAISEMINHYGIVKIKEEISKCEVRCANCHRIKTAKQFGWSIYKKVNGEVA